MPDWCHNILNISGPEKDISLFKTKADGPNQSYNEYHSARGEWPVHNDIRIKALAETLPELGESSVFSFHALYPVPDEVRRLPYDDASARKVAEQLGRTVTHGGYTWEYRHWGCKWGPCDPHLESEESSFLSYSFNTPWSPPMTFLEKVSVDWPTLFFEIEYTQEGHGVAGKSTFENGGVIEAYEWDPGPHDEDWDE